MWLASIRLTFPVASRQATSFVPSCVPEEARHNLRITNPEFDEVAAELGRTLDAVKVPKREKDDTRGSSSLAEDDTQQGAVDL